MRNPERIPEIMAKIGEAWIRHPDWRFGQLVSNVMSRLHGLPTPLADSREGIVSKRATETEIFYTEDEVLTSLLDEALTDPPSVVP